MITCDTHCDLLWDLIDKYKEPVVTMENLKKGGVSLQTCTLFAGLNGYEKDPYGTAMLQFREFERLKKNEGWEQARSPFEAEDGKVKAMLSLEGGEILEGSVERLEEFFELGVRMIALTWNRENEIGYPAKMGTDKGIKPAGWEILKRMSAHHIAADTSHLNEAGFYDLIERHDQPPMASHSCVKSLCNHFRNLTDDQIRKMIERGGWIGINFYPGFLSETGSASISVLCDHIDYICQLGGSAHVGLGSDFDGIETTPVDLRTPADIPMIFEELRRRGYDENTIRGIAGENFLAYYRRLEG